MNPLIKLSELGQSPWYDNIERRLFDSGEFDKLITEYGILGVTSNPTIFEKAVQSSDLYDSQIQELTLKGKSAEEVYDDLTIEDVGRAADALKGVFDRSKGMDGYVSIEVLPKFAHDVKQTVEYATRIFSRLNRKNIMIKVPGTKNGCRAITELIGKGINVNVTLLFSVPHYDAIARAYIDGIKNRIDSGGDASGVRSVASVFVSRIDSRIDSALELLAEEEADPDKRQKILALRGRSAVANMKMVYQRFKQLFFNEGFKELAKKGANIQRVLWASTGTKNPAYSDIKYIQELIAPDSINTIPHKTLIAFHDHGDPKLTIEEDTYGAEKDLDFLKTLGIDIDLVCDQIQDKGVQAFVDSFDSLIGSIRNKAQVVAKKA
ncbi:MAG: transaldolase [Candidatus Omnitrophota bacterium]